MTIYKSDQPSVEIDENPMGTQILESIWKHSLHDPNKKAFVNAKDENDFVTYRELYLKIHSFVAFLAEIGVKQGDIVAPVMRNRWEYSIILFGSWVAGATVSPASFAFTDWELARQLNDCKASLLICDETSLETVLPAIKNSPSVKKLIILGDHSGHSVPGIKVYSFTDALRTAPLNSLPKIRWNTKNDVCIIPYSSGTTGPPKGVMITHCNMSAMMAMFRACLFTSVFKAIEPDYDPRNESVLIFLPFYHVYGSSLVTNSMFIGGTSVIMSSFEPEVFCSVIERYRMKTVSVVPPILVFMAKSPIVDKYDLSSLKFVASGAAPLGQDLSIEVMKRLPNVKGVHQGYGMTEMTMASHRMAPLLAVGDKISSIGTLMPNVESKIVDPNTGKSLGPYQNGEICVRSPGVMKGYLNRRKETADTIDSEGWLHTGDIGYVDKDGFFFIVDRLKELIKVRGFQVPPAELEDLLLSHPLIDDAAVIGVKDQRSGELPKAFIVRKSSTLTAEEVKKFVAEKTAPYKHLKGGVEFIEQIPRSLSGKILRKELRGSAGLAKL
ncbi:unnamed protein product [Bursaphelenchus xylophilus]|uniref:(pine wood nematode) hypothetical protein n=1 Tax=Bursaphelenchus xylophilus TaxID=6326 RepID=A0A1I7S4B5_BURXY|nr:unnamed protein product [Bursaphelenchus xylophilus]CAG9116920.1 unnamed protein product [Bursaphelenchus xylophilus]